MALRPGTVRGEINQSLRITPTRLRAGAVGQSTLPAHGHKDSWRNVAWAKPVNENDSGGICRGEKLWREQSDGYESMNASQLGGSVVMPTKCRQAFQRF